MGHGGPAHTFRWAGRGRAHERARMPLEVLKLEVLGEHIRVIKRGRDKLHPQRAGSFQLTHLEETSINVTRPVARLAIAGELDGARSIDVQHGGNGWRESEFAQ